MNGNMDCKNCVNCDSLHGFMCTCHYSYDDEKGHHQVGRDMYHEKAAFVDEYLRPLCMRVDETLTEVEYMPFDDTELETVRLKWENGHSKLVNVTFDSLGALARDVLRAMQ